MTGPTHQNMEHFHRKAAKAAKERKEIKNGGKKPEYHQ
jgi:hypothetical protein